MVVIDGGGDMIVVQYSLAVKNRHTGPKKSSITA